MVTERKRVGYIRWGATFDCLVHNRIFLYGLLLYSRLHSF